MLSIIKPLQKFNKLNKYLSKYNTHFKFNNKKQIIFSNNINNKNTFIILKKIISLHKKKNILINITQTPYIIKLTDNLIKNNIPYKLISKKNYTKYHLPTKQIITLIKQNQL